MRYGIYHILSKHLIYPGGIRSHQIPRSPDCDHPDFLTIHPWVRMMVLANRHGFCFSPANSELDKVRQIAIDFSSTCQRILNRDGSKNYVRSHLFNPDYPPLPRVLASYNLMSHLANRACDYTKYFNCELSKMPLQYREPPPPHWTLGALADACQRQIDCHRVRDVMSSKSGY